MNNDRHSEREQQEQSSSSYQRPGGPYANNPYQMREDHGDLPDSPPPGPSRPGQYQFGRYQEPSPNPYQSRRQEEYRWNVDDYAAADRPRRERRVSSLAIFGVLLTVVLIIGMAGLSIYGVYSFLTREEPLPEHTPFASSEEPRASSPSLTIQDRPEDGLPVISAEGKLSTVEIAKRVRPSVVGVVQYSGYNTFTPAAEGSGIIMNSDGYILTNAHVVKDALGINVELYNGDSFSAQLIGLDSKTDLAIIKIESPGLIAAEFGNSDELEVGEKVVAIGNPGGTILAGSVTQGIVSGVNRVLSDSGATSTFIQVDAAINPGNSGGALVNEYGQVVGINSSKIAAVEYEGIGFAIPINQAKPIIDDLLEFGYVKGRVKIGITGTEINEALAYMNDLPVGIYIWTIDPLSDLAGKNVSKGDIITHVDGNRIEGFDDLNAILEAKAPGDTIRLTFYRSDRRGTGNSFDVSVRLMEDIDSSAITAPRR